MSAGDEEELKKMMQSQTREPTPPSWKRSPSDGDWVCQQHHPRVFFATEAAYREHRRLMHGEK